MIIREDKNTYTGLRFEIDAVESRKLFVIRRYHTEPIPVAEQSEFMKIFEIDEIEEEDEELIFNDFFEANNVYSDWLIKY